MKLPISSLKLSDGPSGRSKEKGWASKERKPPSRKKSDPFLRFGETPAPNAYDLPKKAHDHDEIAVSFGYKAPTPPVMATPGPGYYGQASLSHATKPSFPKAQRFPNIAQSRLSELFVDGGRDTRVSKLLASFTKAPRAASQPLIDAVPGPGAYEVGPSHLFQQFNKSTKINPPPTLGSKEPGAPEGSKYDVIKAYKYLFCDQRRNGKFSQGRRFKQISSNTLNCSFYSIKSSSIPVYSGGFSRARKEAKTGSHPALGPGAYEIPSSNPSSTYTFGFRRRAKQPREAVPAASYNLNFAAVDPALRYGKFASKGFRVSKAEKENKHR